MKPFPSRVFALSAAIMMAATFTACSDKDNPVDHKPFNDGDFRYKQ